MLKAICTNCGMNETNHLILREYDHTITQEPSGVQWWGTYQIIQCSGCDRIHFRETNAFSEDWDPYDGNPIERVWLYPENLKDERTPMNGADRLPATTREIYSETLRSMNSHTPILAAVGLRAIIEATCKDQCGKAKNLEKSIDELAEKGLLGSAQAEILHGLRFMGNDAVHDIKAPSMEQLLAALDIAETLLKTIYVLPILATGLRKRKKDDATKPE